jgi:hypothetical protein
MKDGDIRRFTRRPFFTTIRAVLNVGRFRDKRLEVIAGTIAFLLGVAVLLFAVLPAYLN